MRSKQLLFTNRIFLFFICFSALLHAQDKQIIIKDSIPDGDGYKWEQLDVIDLNNPDLLLENILNNEFSRLITGNTLAGIGNYASVSTENKTLEAAINVIKNKQIVTFKASGSIADDVTNIFSNSRLNNVSLGFAYHRLFWEPNLIAINNSDVTAIDNELIKLESTLRKEVIEANNFSAITQGSIDKKEKEIGEFKTKIKVLDNSAKKLKELKEAKKKLDSINKAINKEALTLKSEIQNIAKKPGNSFLQLSRNNIKLTLLQARLNDLNAQQLFLDKKLKENQKEKESLIKLIAQKGALKKLYISKTLVLINEISDLKSKQQYYEQNLREIKGTLRNNYIDAIRDNVTKINDIRATDIDISWMSIGGDINYQTFNLFDATRSIDSQVYKDNYLVPTFFLAFSGYSNTPLFGKKKSKNSNKPFNLSNYLNLETKHIRYYSIGFNGIYGNNLSSLALTEVRSTTAVQEGRDLVKRENAYLGTFKEEELSGQFFADYYQFMGNKNNVGFHLKGTLDVGNFRPVSSVRAGFLLPFTKSKDLKSSVNLEIFFGLNDLFNKANKKSLLSRNIFGIQASLPLNFKLI